MQEDNMGKMEKIEIVIPPAKKNNWIDRGCLKQLVWKAGLVETCRAWRESIEAAESQAVRGTISYPSTLWQAAVNIGKRSWCSLLQSRWVTRSLSSKSWGHVFWVLIAAFDHWGANTEVKHYFNPQGLKWLSIKEGTQRWDLFFTLWEPDI